jgi:LAGLIDADG DNA endonuclease family protein
VDSALINTFPEFFGVGYISTGTYNNTSVTTYTTSSLKDAFVIIKHFEKYPLLTKKSKDFED